MTARYGSRDNEIEDAMVTNNAHIPDDLLTAVNAVAQAEGKRPMIFWRKQRAGTSPTRNWMIWWSAAGPIRSDSVASHPT